MSGKNNILTDESGNAHIVINDKLFSIRIDFIGHRLKTVNRYVN